MNLILNFKILPEIYFFLLVRLIFDFLLANTIRTFIKNEMVMNIEKMNIPPRPYKCNVLLPVLSMSGIDTRVIPTIIAPIPIVANFALSSDNPELVNKLVE